MAKGWTDRGIQEYRAALRFNPNHAEAHNNLGVALAMTGRLDEAIVALSRAARLAPDNPDYASNLARARAAATSPPVETPDPVSSQGPSRP
jgi:cytochrome c-type biogenesis protein CcmH/NrfG